MKKSSLLRHLFKSTFITMFLVELSNTISCVVDGLITSRYLGSIEMAAYGMAAPYFSIASIISGILMVGGQTLCAQSIGAGDKKTADKVFSTICLTGTALSVILAVVGFIFSDQIAMLFGARGDYASLMPYASTYLKGLFLGTPFFVMLAVLAPIVQLDGGGDRANMASIVVTVVDIAADLAGVLLFKGSLLTIAIATSLSYFAGCAVLFSHFLRKKAGFRFKLNICDGKIAKDVIGSGIPRGASMVCRALGPIFINLIVLNVASTEGMTAMSVQANAKFLLWTPAWGIAGAVLLLSSLYIGEKDKILLKETMSLAGKYVVFLIGCIAGLTFVFAKQIADFYLPNDPAVAPIAATAIRWFSISLPFTAMNQCLANFLQSSGKNLGTCLMNISSELVFNATCAFVLGKLFGLNGIWAAFPAGQALLLLVYVIVALCKGKKRYGANTQGSEPKDSKDHDIKDHDIKDYDIKDILLCIQNDAFVSEDNRLYSAMENMDDVTRLSGETAKFCADRGIEKRRSFLAALFMEELARNVVEHGFDDGKKHCLEAVVAIDGGEVILRIHDDCRKFNLKEKAANWKLDPEHPEKNMGIRLVLGMAKDVSYASSMNTNNIIIKI